MSPHNQRLLGAKAFEGAHKYAQPTTAGSRRNSTGKAGSSAPWRTASKVYHHRFLSAMARGRPRAQAAELKGLHPTPTPAIT